MSTITKQQQKWANQTLPKVLELVNRPQPMKPDDVAGWQEIIAQLLEQLGPFLIELLISLLLKQRAEYTKTQ